MSLPHVIDPLEAVDLLVAEISGSIPGSGDMSGLIRAIDVLIYCLHLIGPEIPDIEESDLEPPKSDYREVYEAIGKQYPNLGYYWAALDPIIKNGTEDKISVGDAIDDLADILIDLHEVQWFREHSGQRDALASLRWRYNSHLWMHLHSLRHYLEEVKRDD